MDKIEMMVMGLSSNRNSNNAFVLVLKEVDGTRRLPIIIGAFEAQAIALELEGVEAPRPMTHDLIKNMIDTFSFNLSEVYIHELKDGTFYAKLIFEDSGFEIDARPSDAIAIAVRCNCPIFVSEELMEEVAISSQVDDIEEFNENPDISNPSGSEQKTKKLSKVEVLQQQLENAIKREDYEKAASLRDELKRILESS